MFRYSFVVLCAVLVLTNLAFTNAGKFGGGGGSRGRGGGGRGGGAYYPPSRGLSGSGHSGGAHYPASNGLSGSGSGHSGGASYPASNGLSGHGHGTSNQGAKYPASNGLSGSNNHYQGGRVNHNTGGTTHVHHHYHYSPPQQIHYGASTYPVYRGSPPTYVYQYKDSGSKYGTLLAGLALFNLGALAGVAGSQIHSHNHKYVPKDGEVCLFGVRKDNGDYEQTKIDCALITSFMIQDQPQSANGPTNSTSHTVTTSTMNVTIVNTTNTVPGAPQPAGAANVDQSLTILPNGTLVSANASTNGATDTPAAPAGGSSSVTVVTTTTNTTVVDALEAKGAPVRVTPGMTCYVIRNIRNVSVMKKTVPCGVLQTYADKSLKPNSAVRNVPAFTILALMCAVFYVY